MKKLLFILILILIFAGNIDFAHAQSMTIDFGQGSEGDTTGRILQMIALITVLSLAPSILVMVTSFTRMVVVLSFIRTALGMQQTPPNMVLVSLAFFLTLFVMMPTFQVAYNTAIAPLIAEDITEREAAIAVVKPFREFMLKHTREKDLQLFVEMSKTSESTKTPETAEDIPLQAIVPAFIISELRRAFEIGFLLFVPFIIIDMVVASLLMSMGMMMLPPVMISLPFKIIFFVLVDGWYMLAGSLVQGYSGGG